MIDEPPDPTGDRMREPEGPDTPTRKPPPEPDEQEGEEPEPLPG